VNHGHQADCAGPRYFGLYPAIVTDIVDPEELGRIQLRFPWLGEDGERDVRAWATLLSPYADDDQGLEILPEVDSLVVVGFEAGDPRRPYIVGACWNGRERLPESPDAANNKRLLKTRAASVLEFDDSGGSEKITLLMASGHRVVLDNGARSVTVEHSGGSVITLNAAGQVEITANSTVEVNAAAVNVHAPVANFDGIINCTTLIASSGVVSPAYTPGVGNVW